MFSNKFWQIVVAFFLFGQIAFCNDPKELKIESSGVVECTTKTKAGNEVLVHYTGMLEDGTVFDSSYQRSPIKFRLGSGAVIKGWDQGLMDMCVGEKRKLTIPYNLAYGDRDLGIIPPKSNLIFETELIEIDGKNVRDEL